MTLISQGGNDEGLSQTKTVELEEACLENIYGIQLSGLMDGLGGSRKRR